MTRLLTKNSRLKTKGFMLTEVIFSLFITILVLSILQNLLLSIKKANMNENQHVNDVAYAYVQLNNFMHAENTKNVYPITKDAKSNRTTFVRVDKNGEEEMYAIEYYLKNHVLKVSKAGADRGGYMPLIFNIKSAHFATKKDQIIIHVVEKDKKKSDLVFKLDEESRPEREKKIVKNKGKRAA
ncbi:ComGF family competence protein [Lactobacillus helveticus]|nr:ComGF family competence protein [Lactobacillus helveticus]